MKILSKIIITVIILQLTITPALAYQVMDTVRHVAGGAALNNNSSSFSASPPLSVDKKEIYYRNNLKQVREKIRIQPTYSVIDRLIQLDELAHYHTYYDQNYAQVVKIHKKIKKLFAKNIKNCINYKSRYIQKELPIPLLIRILRQRVSTRNLFFKNLISASSTRKIKQSLTLWKSVTHGGAKLDHHEMIEIERQVIAQLPMSASTRSFRKMSNLLVQYNNTLLKNVDSLTLFEKTELYLFQSYLYARLGRYKSSLRFYKKSKNCIDSWVKNQCKLLKKNNKKYCKLANEYKELQEHKMYGLIALALLVQIGTGIIVHNEVKGSTIWEKDYNDSLMNSYNSNMNSMWSSLGRELSTETAKLNSALFDDSKFMSNIENEIYFLHIFLSLPMILELIPVVERQYILKNDYTTASQILDLYFSYADHFRSTISDTATRERFQRQMSQMYSDSLLCALRNKNTQMLFDTIEKYSSKTLFDLMVSERFSSTKTGSNTETPAAGHSGTLVAERGGIKNSALTSSKHEVEMITGLIDAKTLRYKEATKYLKKKKMSYAKILVSNGNLAVLKFENGSFSLAKTSIYKGEFNKFVRQFNHKINSMASRGAMNQFVRNNRVASFLAGQLFASSTKLLLIYDNFTSRFPVTALVKNNHYLIEQRPVFYQVSLSMDRHIARKNPGKVHKISNSASFGNPLRKGKYRRLENLVSAEMESRYVAKTLGGKLFTGKNATKEKLLHSLMTRNIVHVASHSAFNNKNPLFSVIVIPSAKGRSCSLTAGELYNVPIHCKTVILSSCESGAVKETKGNEINGFVRPLLANSVKNILMARIAIGDESSYFFMRSVVDSYKKSKDMVSSFQDAIKKLIADGKFAKPIYWSPFILFSAT